MLSISRRRFIQTGTSALAFTMLASRLQAAGTKFKIGVTDWNLGQDAKPRSIGLAKSLGFEGVQISLGRAASVKNPPEHLPLSDAQVLEQFLSEVKKEQLPITSTCVDILHQNYLKVKSDPLGRKWVAESIPLTRKLGARVILLPFFGKGALRTRAEMDYVGDVLKELAPEAEKAGAILGLENTISAEDNARIMDRAQSKALQVYYDVGNSQRNGFDIYKEIPWLGRDRICEIHLKDADKLLGKGVIDFQKVFAAIEASQFKGWLVLETNSPSGDLAKDMKANLAFVREMMGKYTRG